jgi:urea transporter
VQGALIMQFYEQHLAYIRKIINNNATITINYQEGVVVTGPFINAGAVLLGGVLGAVLSQRLPERIRVSMTSIFGLASLGIGILLVVKCANLPVMVLATLLGALIGEFCYLEKALMRRLVRHNEWFPGPVNTAVVTMLLCRIMSLSSSCFAPAAPGFSAQCMKE